MGSGAGFAAGQVRAAGLRVGTGEAALAAGVAVLAAVMFAPPLLGDGDTFWHLASGEWILAHRAVPHADPFSYTRPGQPWVAHEWLSEVAMALSFRAAGWAGVVILLGARRGWRRG